MAKSKVPTSLMESIHVYDDKEVVKYVVDQLVEDGVAFLIFKPHHYIIVLFSDNPKEAITRADNNAYYWLHEAPAREAPYNSTDDY